jgi:hypothetical protein
MWLVYNFFLVLCGDENNFRMFGDKLNFFLKLPFLAHGFVRFLLVAVGEAGRPDVEDD